MTLPVPTALETVVLRTEEATVFVAPGRGGMVTRFLAGERPLLFLDESTLLDPGKNVRGGNPLLFPSPGKLMGDRFSRDGRAGAMGQHGFARNAAWTVVTQGDNEVLLGLVASEGTRAVYPWEFSVTCRYRLTGQTLRIEQHFETSGAAPMPFGTGFHPYFRVDDKTKASIPTRATRAWDNAAKRMVDVAAPIDLTGPEVDLHLVDHRLSAPRDEFFANRASGTNPSRTNPSANEAWLELGDGHRIEVRAAEEFRRWVIWTLAGKDFVCLEPWTSPGDALNSGEDLLTVRRGEPIDLWIEIGFV
jgi:galactose mutarotase-like enzyme